MAPSIIPSCCLTAEQKDALIDAVRERPVIWDCSLADYQEVQNRRAAFSEVADLLSAGKNHYTGPEMQVEWKKLRDIFNRTLKKVVANGGSDADVTWRYWQKLQFIADHERSQIFKAMHKWCTSSSSSASSASKRKSLVANHHHRRLLKSESLSPSAADETSSPASPGSVPSMVQQLAEVAQTAKELLAMEGQLMKRTELTTMGGDDQDDANTENDAMKSETMNAADHDDEEEEREKQEEESKSNTMRDQEEDGKRLLQPTDDPLGQILLLGLQMQNSLPGLMVGTGGIPDDNGSPTAALPFNELVKTERLLNELFAKGSTSDGAIEMEMMATTTNGIGHRGKTKQTTTMSTNNCDIAMRRKRARLMEKGGGGGGGGGDGNASEEANNEMWPTTTLKSGNNGQQQNGWHWHTQSGTNSNNAEGSGWNDKNAGDTNNSNDNGGTNHHDQFDIFGMFIASQVRTLHSQSVQSSRRLKRALTDLCFQFEAEQESAEQQQQQYQQQQRRI